MADLPLPDVVMRAALWGLPTAVLVCDSSGRILFYNPAAASLCGGGVTLGDVIWAEGLRLRRADGSPYKQDDHPIALALRQGGGAEFAGLVLEHPDGVRRSVKLHVTPLASPVETPAGPVACIALLEMESAGRQNEWRRFEAIVRSSDDAIISKDLNGVITSWNPGAERLFGYSPEEAVGRNVTMLIPPNRLDEEPEVLGRIRRGQSIDHYETVRQRKDGSLLDISLSVSPIIDASGRVVGASKIARDITERRRHEQALTESARRKDEFLAMLAHELRNPLAPLSNAVEYLRATGVTAVQAPVVDVVDRQVRHLARLVDDLLEVSRITLGRIQLKTEVVAVSDVVERALEISRPLLEAGGHDIALHFPDEPVFVLGDRVRLTQVLSNLLNNAAKFTQRAGLIRISAKKVGHLASIEVEDNGPGISPELLSEIFELFSRGDAWRDLGVPGLGIGLSLVRQIVELHGGSVQALSEGPGKGSRFIVTLPLEDERLPEASIPASDPAIASRRILVVDDNRDAAATLVMLLTALGHDAHATFGGADALALAESLHPQVVLLDIGMPEMNGYEVAARLRARDWSRGLFIAAVTGWGQEVERFRSQESGFDHHLVKPVSIEAILAAIQRSTTAPRPAS